MARKMSTGKKLFWLTGAITIALLFVDPSKTWVPFTLFFSILFVTIVLVFFLSWATNKLFH